MIVQLRKEFGRYPLAHARPFLDVDGRELVRVVQEEVGLARQLQLVVGRFRPDPRTPDVFMDPGRSSGQPAVRNVRTESLAEDSRAGTSREDLADLYDLTPVQVDEAIRFELIAGRERVA